MERFKHLRFAEPNLEAIDLEITDLQTAYRKAETRSLRKKCSALIDRLTKEREDILLKKEQLQKELDAIRQDDEEAYRIIYYRYVKGLSWTETYRKVIPDVPSADPEGYIRHFITRYWKKRDASQARFKAL